MNGFRRADERQEREPQAGRHAVRTDFRLLLVCTANKCRSPMAEYLFRDMLATAWGDAADSWHISSAGVRTRGGHPMDGNALRTLAEYGIEAGDFVNRTLTPRMVHEADLILTASREHRSKVAALAPGAVSRLFTIKQFGYLMSSIERLPATDPVATGLSLPSVGAFARGLVPARTVEDDLNDPIGGPMALFRLCAEELTATIATILDSLPEYSSVAR